MAETALPLSLRAVFLALALVLTTVVQAGETGFGAVTVTIDESPSFNVTNTGYFTLPITIRNDADTDHDIGIVLSGNDHFDAVIATRIATTLRVPAGSSVRTALYVPPATVSSTGLARVTIDGVLQREGVSTGVIAHRPMLDRGWRGRSRDVFLVLASRQINPALRDAYENHASGDAGYEGFEIARAERDAADWVPEWLAYSRYAMVMIDTDDWLDATPAVREALAGYARTGGVLLIVGTGVTPGELPGAATAVPAEAGFVGTGFGYTRVADDSEARESRAEVMRLMRAAAGARPDSFDLSDAERLLPATPKRSLPIGGILALLFLTAVVIGPVNIIALARMRRRALLFLTTPLLGITFASAIFAVGLLHDGINARVTSRSLTVLDHAQNRATTIAQWGVYAPLPPKGGLSIAPDTEVTPVGQKSFSEASVSFTLDQGPRHTFGGDLVRSRVPAHLILRRDTTRRERVGIAFEGDALFATNGLGVDIAWLVYTTPGGDLYTAENIPAGARAELLLFAGENPPGVGPRRPPDPAPLAMDRFFNTVAARDFTDLPANAYIAVLAGDPFIDVEVRTDRAPLREAIVIGLLEGGAP